MTRYAPLWQQNGTYPAATDRGLLGTLWPASGSAGLAPTLVANTMQVQVAPGTAAVALTTAGALSVLCRSDANEVVTLNAAPPSGQSRIDLVVLQVRDQVLDAGGNNDFIFAAVTGTPAASNPAAPAVPTNAYPVAQVLVPGNVTNLNTATLTDRRIPSLTARDNLHARVYRNAAYSAIPTAAAPLPYDAVTDDAAGMWNISAPGFVIPAPGRYLLCARFAALATAGGQSYDITAYRNGAAHTNGMGGLSVGAQYVKPTLSAVLKCAVGDLVAVYWATTPGLACAQGSLDTWATLDYLGSG